MYSKAAVIRTACYWHQDKCTSKWRRTENPERNPHICNQPIFPGAKRTPGKGASFQEVVSGRLAFICDDAARSLLLSSTHTLFNTGSVRSRGHFQPHLRNFPESAGKPQQKSHQELLEGHTNNFLQKTLNKWWCTFRLTTDQGLYKTL